MGPAQATTSRPGFVPAGRRCCRVLVVGGYLLVFLGRAGGGLVLQGAGDAVGEVPNSAASAWAAEIRSDAARWRTLRRHRPARGPPTGSSWSSAEQAAVCCWYCWTWPARVLCAAVSSEVASVVLRALLVMPLTTPLATYCPTPSTRNRTTNPLAAAESTSSPRGLGGSSPSGGARCGRAGDCLQPLGGTGERGRAGDYLQWCIYRGEAGARRRAWLVAGLPQE